MDALRKLLGVEKDLDEVARAIKYFAQDLRPATVGALHVTCSDESEQGCAESFQRQFVQHLLPRLKFSSQAPYRVGNLGGRYEWGSAPLAENHFATPESASSFKLLAVKINSHVSKDAEDHYGQMQRYHVSSYYCGALRALLDGGHEPYLEELRETFSFEGVDRVALIRQKVPAPVQALAAAIVNARLQARKAVLEIQDSKPHTPTVYLVAPCVTLNRSVRDTELVVGFYLLDRRGEKPSEHYYGLGDDPAGYRFRHDRGTLYVEDDHLHVTRPARDHRALVRQAWRKSKPAAPKALAEAKKKNAGPAVMKTILKAAVLALAEAAPGAAALFLFGEGLVGIHHAWRAHRLTRGAQEHEDARAILREFEQKIEHLSPERAREIVEALHAEYGL